MLWKLTSLLSHWIISSHSLFKRLICTITSCLSVECLYADSDHAGAQQTVSSKNHIRLNVLPCYHVRKKLRGVCASKWASEQHIVLKYSLDPSSWQETLHALSISSPCDSSLKQHNVRKSPFRKTISSLPNKDVYSSLTCLLRVSVIKFSCLSKCSS